MQRLAKLSKEPGFTASLQPGVALSWELQVPSALGNLGDVEMPEVPIESPPSRLADAGQGARDVFPATVQWCMPVTSTSEDSNEEELRDARREARRAAGEESEGEGDGMADDDTDLVADEFSHILNISHDVAGTRGTED
ncbi:hypothetical protein C8R43DRAFT_1117336 [Mycena crocata]|nr:hypothetical protein C8R43DRAFT_1117336 [Mycena crocata]